MKVIAIITGSLFLLKIFYNSIYYKGFYDGLKAMRDRCEKYLNERQSEWM